MSSQQSRQEQQLPATFDDDDDAAYTAAIGDFKPGSITKIQLENFMTHGQVTLYPGPRLNMVIGANGTGKSTILNAICLGLGGDPKLLGRADDLRCFIKHGQAVATIIIHVAPHPTPAVAHVFKRVLDATKGSINGKGRGSSVCYINDEKVSLKQLQAVVSGTYHIAIDNLCTFLPQDKVGNFSGFTDQMRLLETEKTLSISRRDDEAAQTADNDDEEEEEQDRGSFYNVHQELIQAEQDLLHSKGNVETVQHELHKLTREKDLLQREKERMEERQKAIEQAHLYRKKMLWLKFEQKRQQALELKDQRDQIKKQVKEAYQTLAPLEERHAELATKGKLLSNNITKLDQKVTSSKKEMQKQLDKYEKHDEETEHVITQLTTLESCRAKAQQELQAAQQNLARCQEMAQTMLSKERIDEELQQARTLARQTRTDYDQARRSARQLSDQFAELEDRAKQQQDKLAKLQDGMAQRKKQIFQSNPHLQKIAEWIDQNRTQFRRPVWGPIVCEVAPKSRNAAAFLEFHVQNRVLTSFCVETKEDQDLLYAAANHQLKVPINVIQVVHGRLKPLTTRLYSDQKINVLKQEHGVVGYLDETFTAPDTVMQALRDYAGVEKVLVGGEATQQSIDHHQLLDYLNQPDPHHTSSGDPRKRQNACIFSSKASQSFQFQISKSRKADTINIRQSEVLPAKMLAPGVNPRVQEDHERQLAALHEEMNALRPALAEQQKELTRLESATQQAALRAQHTLKNKEHWLKFQSKLERLEQKVSDCESKLQSDDGQEKKKHVQKLFKLLQNTISALAAHKEERRKVMNTTISLSGATLAKTVAAAAERNAEQALASKKKEYKDLETRATQIQAKFRQARQELDQANKVAMKEAPLEDGHGNTTELKAQLEALDVSTLAEAEAALEDAEATIKKIQANDAVFKQYEKLEIDIAKVEAQLEELSSSKESKLETIRAKRKPWETSLTNHIAKINAKFSHYMDEMGCTGEVRLKKGNIIEDQEAGNDTFANFRDWGIEILVSYRENAKAQILSAERHSGGERSVATIMYLMAIQDLMASPFRCVDEINQGLDERNERLVFRRIVANSTGRPKRNNPLDHSGQYFLITPKLLPNMTDMEHEAVTLQIVFNGLESFGSPTDWNMENLMQSSAEESAAEGSSPASKRSHSEEAVEEEPENSQNGIRPRSKKSRRSQTLASADE